MSWDKVGALGGGGALRVQAIQQNIFTSTSIVYPKKGILIVRAMSAAGSGARGAGSATGGYSGAWGLKLLQIAAGTVVTVVVGAGGAIKSVDGNGNNGGDTTVTINGVTYTLAGGLGGVMGGASAPANMSDISALWDYGARNATPGWNSNARTGGAGLDVMALGLGRSGGLGGGGATSDGSNQERGGGAMPNQDTGGGGANALGLFNGTPTAAGIAVDAGANEWGISFYGGGGAANGAGGANGGGGAGGSTLGGDGGNGGGGGGGDTGAGGRGGRAAGGGAGKTQGGKGGDGFVHAKYFIELGA